MTTMMRKLLLALTTGAALALATLPTTASARGVGGFGGHGGMGGHVGMGHVGMGHAGFGHGAFVHRGFGVRHFAFHRGFRHFRRGPFFVAGAYPWVGSCWRWVPGPFGWHRAWVCGTGYGYGWY
jgi:hypothetical protein